MSSDAIYLDIVKDLDVEIWPVLGTEFTIVTPGAYDPETMEDMPESRRQVRGIKTDATSAISLTSSLGGGVTTGDATGLNWTTKEILLLAHDANPKENESVIVDGKRYSLRSVKSVKPANVIIIYTLELVL